MNRQFEKHPLRQFQVEAGIHTWKNWLEEWRGTTLMEDRESLLHWGWTTQAWDRELGDLRPARVVFYLAIATGYSALNGIKFSDEKDNWQEQEWDYYGRRLTLPHIRQRIALKAMTMLCDHFMTYKPGEFRLWANENLTPKVIAALLRFAFALQGYNGVLEHLDRHRAEKISKARYEILMNFFTDLCEASILVDRFNYRRDLLEEVSWSLEYVQPEAIRILHAIDRLNVLEIGEIPSEIKVKTMRILGQIALSQEVYLLGKYQTVTSLPVAALAGSRAAKAYLNWIIRRRAASKIRDDAWKQDQRSKLEDRLARLS